MQRPMRPAWNHAGAKEQAAREIIHDVNHWAQMAGLDEFASSEREFLALVALAIIESADSYNAARYLEDFYEWPADRELINILDRAYARMKFIAAEHTRQWVMQHKVRFPAKEGQGVRVRMGDAEFVGKVVAVIGPEARGVVVPLGKPHAHIPMLAEEVQEVIELKDSKPKGKPPTGGTPAQQRAPKPDRGAA